MYRYVLFNKPFQVMCQFTDASQRSTLADYIDLPDIYSAGRLDYDSEGLLLLTNHGSLINGMMHPKFKVPKTYYAQVEGVPSDAHLAALSKGVCLKDGMTAPCQVTLTSEPDWLWVRNPPIRERKAIPTSWLRITITEGRNRQVRRMTAAIGYPTLRLIRQSIGELSVTHIPSGEYVEVSEETIKASGLNYSGTKKSSKNAAFHKTQSQFSKRSDRRPRRNRPNQTRNQTT